MNAPRAMAVEPDGPSVRSLDVHMVVNTDGSAGVSETYRFVAGPNGIPDFVRTIYPREVPYAFPLKRQLSDIQVLDHAGVQIPDKQARYGHDRTQVAATLPEGRGNAVTLKYTISRAVTTGTEMDSIGLEVFAPHWKLPYEKTSVLVEFPKGVDASKAHAVSQYASHEDALTRAKENKLYLSYPSFSKEDVPWILLHITFPTGHVISETSYIRDLFGQAGTSISLALMILVFGFVLRFLPPLWSIYATIGFHGLIVVALLLLLSDTGWFWIHATPQETLDRWYENGLSEVGSTGGFIAMVGGYMWFQNRALLQGAVGSWYTQFGVPAILLVAGVYGSVHTGFFALMLTGLAILTYWYRTQLMVALGAGLHRVVEYVVTEGQVSMDKLSAHFRVTPKVMARVLWSAPDLPIVPDYEAGQVYSLASNQLKQDYRICGYCGGGVTSHAMARADCTYCGRQYADGSDTEPLPPSAPVIIQSLSAAAKGTAIGLFFYAAGFIILTLVAGFSFGGIGRALESCFFAVVPGALGAFFYDRSEKFIESPKALVWPGAIVAFLIAGVGGLVPAALVGWWWHRRSLRIRIHYGDDSTGLASELNVRGELSLAQAAELLGCKYEEAVSLIRHLCATAKLDAVYDRMGQRIIARELWADVSDGTACESCGGLLGIIGGVLRCHHCGKESSKTTS